MKLMDKVVFILVCLFFFCCKNPDSHPVSNTLNNDDNTEVKQLKKLIQQYPDSLALQQKLIDELEKDGQLAAALDKQIQLSQKDSQNAITHYKLAYLQLQSGDTVSGLQSLRNAIRLAPEFMEARLEMGFVYAGRKNPIALQIADDVLHYTANPSSLTQARYLKAIYFSNINDKNKALTLLEECIINDYSFLDAYFEKGIILFDLKRYPEALKTFEKAQLISNANAEAYYWIGRSYEAMNRKDEAIDFYRKTLGLDRNYEDARAALSRLTE